MSKKLFSRLMGVLSSRTLVGTDKHGNRYFIRNEEIDGVMKEKRWVVFKGEQDPTSLPGNTLVTMVFDMPWHVKARQTTYKSLVEWICWLSGQRKKAPTPQEMMELEAKRERVKLNVALLKKEEERKARDGSRIKTVGKVGPPDLKSFIQQFPGASLDNEGKDLEEVSDATDSTIINRFRKPKTAEDRTAASPDVEAQPVSSEPTGSGQSFRPGTWQPPT